MQKGGRLAGTITNIYTADLYTDTDIGTDIDIDIDIDIDTDTLTYLVTLLPC